ncbi:uncharacterized protein EI97DRAFT_215521 [Westerdykella ornata]|uniref:Uncharacterized protein n=1 Tax=Westerdykella ornata TaxID=318751 RepID=A0A6A6JPQ0_WESOR|nr:uncharacterized protein EI97DRAFT_215521 [Westerdykella ornata]KAF2278630.1 hypothetical protein EI97DRAFT_215521 [Westerdykella ornata]
MDHGPTGIWTISVDLSPFSIASPVVLFSSSQFAVCAFSFHNPSYFSMETLPTLPTSKRYGMHFREYDPTREMLSTPRYVTDRVDGVRSSPQLASPSYYTGTRPSVYRSPESKAPLFLRKTPLPPLPRPQSTDHWGSEVVDHRHLYPPSPDSLEREKRKERVQEEEKLKPKPGGPRSKKTSETVIKTEPTDTQTPFESDAFAVYMPTTRVPVMDHSVGFRERRVQPPYSPTRAGPGGSVIDGSSPHTASYLRGSAHTASPASREQVDAAYQTYKRKAQLVREMHEVEGVRVPEEIVSYAYSPMTTKRGQVQVEEVEVETPAAGAFPVSPPLRQTSERVWGRMSGGPGAATSTPTHTGRGEWNWAAAEWCESSKRQQPCPHASEEETSSYPTFWDEYRKYHSRAEQ